MGQDKLRIDGKFMAKRKICLSISNSTQFFKLKMAAKVLLRQHLRVFNCQSFVRIHFWNFATNSLERRKNIASYGARMMASVTYNVFLIYLRSFNLASWSAKALFEKSSCFFIYLFISFLETRVFCVFFLRFWKASSFSLWPQTHLNVWPSPSP